MRKFILISLWGYLSLAAGIVSAANTGQVLFNGQVALTPKPTCSYSSGNLSVVVSRVDFEKIKSVTEVGTALNSVITPGSVVSTGQNVKNAITGLVGTNGGYGESSFNVTCKSLNNYFVIRTKSLRAANDAATGACASVGCSYLKVTSATAGIQDNFGLAMFMFSPVAGQSNLSAAWIDLNRNNGFTSAAPNIFNATETVNSAVKTVAFGFLLLKKDGTGPSTWLDTKNAGVYQYAATIDMSLVYD